ncbi:MAG TPA: hypothetical protein VNO20_01950 [Solirubrobacterales bacterium]|nr:hypothetical protein [Solirubrobacterales bacterium]
MKPWPIRSMLGSHRFRFPHLAMAGAIVALLGGLFVASVAATAPDGGQETTPQQPGPDDASSPGSEDGKTKKSKKEDTAEGLLSVNGASDGLEVELVACGAGEDDERQAADAPPSPCSQPIDSLGTHIGGRATILLESKAKLALEASYVPDGGDAPIRLTKDSGWVFLSESSPSALEAGQVAPLTIGFALDPGTSPTAIDGTLVLRGTGETKGEPATAVVPVSGTIRQFKQLSVQPKTLQMNSDKRKATVTLAGADLIEFLTFAGFGRPSAVLSEEGGGTAEVELRLQSPENVAATDHPDQAKAVVRLTSEDVSPGAYEGKLVISEFIPGAPETEIELSSGRCFLLLILLVVLGVLAGAVLTRLVSFAMRRQHLLEVLAQSTRPYELVRQSGPTASWRLGDLVGAEVDPEAEGEGQGEDGSEEEEEGGGDEEEESDGLRLHGVQGLIESIKTARSSADLDEDTDRVLDMVARLQRWIRVEPAARRLKQVDEEAQPESMLPLEEGKTKGWHESNARRDTRVLLEFAQREPADAKAADDLVWRLLRQAEWHHAFAKAWDAAAGNADRLAKVAALDVEVGKDSDVGSRRPEKQDMLDARLHLLAIEVLGSFPKTPGLEKEPPKNAGITAVQWEASPNLFTGWATLDGQSYGQLARFTARGARRPGWPDAGVEARAFIRPVDLFGTFNAVVIASFVYGMSEYSDTWGSTKDIATAVLAGVLGKVVIDWGALPIFQSIRLRAAKAAAEATDGGGAAAPGGTGGAATAAAGSGKA